MGKYKDSPTPPQEQERSKSGKPVAITGLNFYRKGGEGAAPVHVVIELEVGGQWVEVAVMDPAKHFQILLDPAHILASWYHLKRRKGIS